MYLWVQQYTVSIIMLVVIACSTTESSKHVSVEAVISSVSAAKSDAELSD